jgi:hypothetical protein
MHCILPLKSILADRHIGDSGECPLCHLHPKTVLHMIFQCEGAVAIWRALRVEDTITSAMHIDRSG